MKLYYLSISLFILTMFMTRTLGATGSGILGRITLADLFGLIGLLALFISSNKFTFTKSARASFLMILLLSAGIITSYRFVQTSIEILILSFLLLIYISIESTFRSPKGLHQLISLFALTSLIASGTGIWDLISEVTALPRIFPPRNNGEVMSGFRNAGQAGAFILVALSVFLPYRFTLFESQKRPTKILLNVTIFFSILFLLMTGKVAAYIGFGIGLFLYIIIKRKIGLLLPFIALGIFFPLVIVFTQEYVPSLYRRVNHKIQTRIVRNTSGERDLTKEGFFAENLGGAIQAFKDNLLTGSGLGGFGQRYGRHEVHSTYFKILGEGGLLGVFGYSLFIITFLSYFFNGKEVRRNNPYAKFLSHMFPFIIGCLVSWAYTYHLRKREFWILLAIITIAHFLMKQHSYNLKNRNIINNSK